MGTDPPTDAREVGFNNEIDVCSTWYFLWTNNTLKKKSLQKQIWKNKNKRLKRKIEQERRYQKHLHFELKTWPGSTITGDKRKEPTYISQTNKRINFSHTLVLANENSVLQNIQKHNDAPNFGCFFFVFWGISLICQILLKECISYLREALLLHPAFDQKYDGQNPLPVIQQECLQIASPSSSFSVKIKIELYARQ